MKDINTSMSEIQKELVDTKITVTQLRLHARHLLMDPKGYLKGLADLQASMASIAAVCNRLPTLINQDISQLITTSNSNILQRIETLSATVSNRPNDSQSDAPQIYAEALNTLTERLDTLARENRELTEASNKKTTAFNKKLDDYSTQSDQLSRKVNDLLSLKEDTENCHEVFEKLPSLISDLGHAENVLLAHLSEDMKTLISRPSTSSDNKPSSNTTSTLPHQPLPYRKLTHGFLKAELLKDLKEWLKTQEFTRIGKREVLYVGEYDYWYGGVKHKAFTPPPLIQEILDFLNTSKGNGKSKSNSCLITRYVNGSSVCPEHEDDEPVINPASDINTLSIGATRKMLLRRKTSTGNVLVEELELPENSLLTFCRKSQDYFTHEIPADSSADEVRYSLTFRDIKPYYLNSTVLIGDSNCHAMNFDTNKPMCFGKWMPGDSYFSPRISKIPGPEELLPYRNFIINVGINDLTTSAPLPPHVLVSQLESKCHAIHQVYPRSRIFLMGALPTKSLRVNSWVQEFNYHLKVLGDKDVNLIYVNTHHIFSDAATGLLHEHCASRKSSDIKHLNKTGIFKLRDLFKECIMNRKKSKGQEVPWCYPSHNSSSSPMEPFDHSVVPKNCVLRSKRRFSLGSCDSGRGGSGLSPQVSSLAAEPGVPGLDTDEDSHSLSHAPPLP